MAKENRPRQAPPDPARRKPSPAETAEKVVRKIDDTITRKAAQIDRKAAQLERKAAQLERVSARLQDHQDILQQISGHLGALEVWTRDEPGGRRPRFTREEIAATAVRIADREGFAAVSMRRLANELGAGTMTLYHYVRTKDELLTLVNDTVMGEVVVPPDQPLPPHWRDAVAVIARRSRDAMLRHPWTLDITDDPPVGPNGVRHFDQTLQAVAGLDADLRDKLDIVLAVDEYVFGYCFNARNNVAEAAFADGAMMAYCADLVATGEYPQLAALVDEYGVDGTWAVVGAHHRDEDRFERNLTRLLDGIEASLSTD